MDYLSILADINPCGLAQQTSSIVEVDLWIAIDQRRTDGRQIAAGRNQAIQFMVHR